MVRRLRIHHCDWCDMALTEGDPVWAILDSKGKCYSYSCFHHKKSNKQQFKNNMDHWAKSGYTIKLATYGHEPPPSQFKEWFKRHKDKNE